MKLERGAIWQLTPRPTPQRDFTLVVGDGEATIAHTHRRMNVMDFLRIGDMVKSTMELVAVSDGCLVTQAGKIPVTAALVQVFALLSESQVVTNEEDRFSIMDWAGIAHLRPEVFGEAVRTILDWVNDEGEPSPGQTPPEA